MSRLTFLSELPGPAFDALLSGPVVGALARLGASVSMATLDVDAPRGRALSRLADAGVPVVAWLVVDVADGYWAHARNAAPVLRRFEVVRELEHRTGVRFASVAVDVEPRWGDDDALPTAGVRLAGRLLRRVLTPDELARCEAEWAAVCSALRGDGRRVLAYHAPPMLDEDRTLVRRTLGTVRPPVDVEIPMLYSSFARPLGAGLVASYARGARAVAVGSTGGGVTAGGLDRVRPLSFVELARDLGLVAHVPEVHLFSLEGCVAQGLLERLEALDRTARTRAVGARFAVDALRAVGRGIGRLGR